MHHSIPHARPNFSFPRVIFFFFLFRSRAQTDSLADLYQIFPNTLKRLYERKKVNIILYALFRTIRDIAGTSSCVILHSLNSKILILMKNTRILRSDTKEILFQEIRGKFLFFLPPLETFLHLKVKNTFVKMYMG